MNDVRTGTMQVTRTARYGVLGTPGPDVREVWIALHGYGHSAEVFGAGLAPIAAPHRLIVVPEGLSRFYLRGSRGDVGASWMTKVEREAEIEDQRAWLDAFHDEVFGWVDRDRVVLHVFGFSQGAATACRWIAGGRPRPDRVTLWAGGVPRDLSRAALTDHLPSAGLLIVVGERDHYIDAERLAARLEWLREGRVPFEFVGHPGGHRLVPELLVELFGTK